MMETIFLNEKSHDPSMGIGVFYLHENHKKPTIHVPAPSKGCQLNPKGL